VSIYSAILGIGAFFMISKNCLDMYLGNSSGKAAKKIRNGLSKGESVGRGYFGLSDWFG